MNKTRFCDGWRFGEIGKDKVPALLPHDATQLQGRAADAPSGSGGAYYKDGTYEYTMTFEAPESWREQYVSLLFEGVYPQAKVYLNGREIGGCAYGYSLFEVELKGLKYGEENEITVLVEHKVPNSRWYAGAGIYRPVWLLQGNAAHIPFDGVKVTTLSYDPAEIRVETTHTGEGQVCVEIQDGEKAVAFGEGNNITFSIPEAKLWDAEHPNLYTCRVTLKDGEAVLDEAETKFGIRTIEYSPRGLFINGKETLLKGGCIHSDNGILGSRTFDESEWRRVRILKEHGFNAIRSAHNPLCRAALEACDALGMYVMDETWDMWDKHKTEHDYAERFTENWKYDVKAMVAKDYNHPSVILYSIGNEVTEPARHEGVKLAGEIITEIRKNDAARTVTGGMNLMLILLASKEGQLGGGDYGKKQPVNSTEFNEMIASMGQRMIQAAATKEADEISAPTLDQLDIVGYNYAQSRYESDGAQHPGRVIVGSETFPQDLPGNWAMVEKLPWLTGDFMWTAWDYLGEVGIGAWTSDVESQEFGKPWPWKLGDTGALDILGNDTAEAGMASVIWGARKRPYIAVRPFLPEGQTWLKAMWRGSNAIPSWSWKGCEGQETEVEVYTKASEAELFINGVSQGRKPVENTKAVFNVIYQPGEIKAVAYHANGVEYESILRSANGTLKPVIAPEEWVPQIGKLLYVDISIRGENNEIESNADETLTVRVKGGKLLAFGSANPKTEEEYHTGTYTTYRGRALAAIIPESQDVEITVCGQTTQAAWKTPTIETVISGYPDLDREQFIRDHRRENRYELDDRFVIKDGKKHRFAVICPGGGYSMVCNYIEGVPFAKKLNEKSISAFIVYYRVRELAHYPAPQDDLARAIKEILNKAKAYNLDAENYSVWGSSAGGHLAGSFGTDNMGYARYSLPKPGAMVLIYPVINMDKSYTEIYTHNQLLGTDATKAEERYASIDEQVTVNYPPTYIWCGDADRTVPPDNTRRMAAVLDKVGIPCKCEIFPGVDHGIGLGTGTPAEGWIDRAVDFWMNYEIEQRCGRGRKEAPSRTQEKGASNAFV